MKQLLLLLFGVFFSLHSFAQITITEDMLPAIGDSLKTKTDAMPSGIDLLLDAGEHSWDFTSLQSNVENVIVVQDAQDAAAYADFPNSTMVMPTGQIGGEGYFAIEDGILKLLGFAGSDPIGLGFNVSTPFTPAIEQQRAPLSFLDANTSEYSLLFPFDPADLPVNIFENLPISPDSIRVRVSSERYDLVNGWGTLTIPGGIYDVLREKRTEYRETRLDAKISFLGWQDITDIVLSTIDNEAITNALGQDTTQQYYFFSNEAKEPIAIVEMATPETNEVQSVTYKSNILTNTHTIIKADQPAIFASPNPAIVNVRFEFANLATGNYKLKIYNIVGQQLWEKDYFVQQPHFMTKEDVSWLSKGTYLYSLSDENGRTLATKRLVIVRP